ncbi:MAG TPA: bifunctional phosphoribosylaminoimidazolecarboxamide formyltransferase/IMP cyclohydrolase [Longimicrobiales bacterium]|nr:bifunctional phosphoribosylaminoimidazolecarboxamide formyltransferase/IMP cyclohydrolase [Longimicrobiales bacterium]
MARAILSVSDKTGIVDFARGLAQLGWELVSTGGTAAALRQAGIPVRDVSEVTGHPEMMEGRVKTLHPAVHAGILARRDVPEDLRALASHGYPPFELVAVNLYPFTRTVTAATPLAAAMEQVDIGGPTMLRAAAKNHRFVLPVVDPADYPRVLQALRGGEPEEFRVELARKVFAHTSTYDAAVAAYLGGLGGGAGEAESRLPGEILLRLHKVQDLRYGENPDQAAGFYAEEGAPDDALPSLRQLHGKELSFNNLLDIEAATWAVAAWPPERGAACVIVKHNTPCGVALAGAASDAYTRALQADPVSAFGGIVAYNVTVDGGAVEAMANTFLEVVVAPGFTEEALELLRRKKNLRLIELPLQFGQEGELDYKRVRGGMLVQDRMRLVFREDAWRVVTKREPSEQEWRDLRFAWRVVAAVKSNAIVLARDEMTLGIGAGQTSRVDSARVAVMKANDQGLALADAALASDAFFPFRDGVDTAAAAGVRSVIQPGGSVRDEEVIAAADEHGLAMVFTGRRVFRH